MSYAKLYVNVYTHPKFIKAGFEASGYWMHALAYLRHQESSDGFLSDDVIATPLSAKRRLCRRLCEKLVSAGLFHRVEGGYVLLNYAQKNQTKASILDARAAARERKFKSRERRAAPSPRSQDGPTTPTLASPVTGDTMTSVTPNEENLSRGLPRINISSLSSSISSLSFSDRRSEKKRRGGDGARDGAGDRSLPLDRAATGGDTPGAPRPLPPSERATSGSFWLEAFTEGISARTGRPCTAGRMYLGTLERLIEHHAPARDAPSACAWLREQASAFAAQWDGHHPPKGLTPDGLERWLNEGRRGPPEFGKPRVLQLPPEEWVDDFGDPDSDLGAGVVRADGEGDASWEDEKP
jgi:hypothetical protein